MDVPRSLGCAAACWLLHAPVALAAPSKYGEDTPLSLEEPVTPKASGIGGGTGGSLTRTLVGLVVVVAVIYGVAWVLRQMRSSKEERSIGSGLASVAAVPLGPSRSVHLIRAGRDLVLVGCAEQGVVPIKTYTEDEARRVGLLDVEGQAAPSAASVLDRLKQRTAR